MSKLRFTRIVAEATAISEIASDDLELQVRL
jgi:hypothetical protein